MQSADKKKEEAMPNLDEQQKKQSQQFTAALLEGELKAPVALERGEENALVITVPKENQVNMQRTLDLLRIPNRPVVSANSVTFVINLTDLYLKMMRDVMCSPLPMILSYVRAALSYIKEHPKATLEDMFPPPTPEEEMGKLNLVDPLEFHVQNSVPSLFVRLAPKGKMNELIHIANGVDMKYEEIPHHIHSPVPHLDVVGSTLVFPSDNPIREFANLVRSPEFAFFANMIRDMADPQEILRSAPEETKRQNMTLKFFQDYNSVLRVPNSVAMITGDYIEHPLRLFCAYALCVLGNQREAWNSATQFHSFGRDDVLQLCNIIAIPGYVPPMQPKPAVP